MTDILAPMSGNIWKILIKEGDSVQADDELIIMEAMKMEIPVAAPANGVIKTLAVHEGDAVDADKVLITLE
ncbi:MAG: acetyl-CoA carboxylase biotin carboxyl carrier protein subunit [Deltaproteobacteria bacterium]|nr:acetyl-CoA carboxylase biotin carboxyl carrier protein subunit [Deltaproteobacteria bacterium]